MRLDARRDAWLPTLVLIAGAIPLVSPTPYLMQSVMALSLMLIYVLSWNLYFNFIRDTNFGHAFFIGGAGYLSAGLATSCHWPVWLAMVCAVFMAAICAGAIAWVADRAKGAAFALLTMALQLMLYQLAFLAPQVFGGEQGIIGVPRLTDSPLGSYYCIWLALITTIVLGTALAQSAIGRLLLAVGDDEALARSCGIRTKWMKIGLFSTSGALGGLGGALYAHTTGQINTEMLSSALSVAIVLLALAGGSGTGPALVVVLFFTLREVISGYISAESLVYAAALFLTVLALPGGLIRRGHSR
jgi:branched-chain amino acid transport system permease protein